MKISDLPTKKLAYQLKDQGININIGPYCINLSSTLATVAVNLKAHYGAYNLATIEDITDFYINVDAPSLSRRWLRPQAVFSFDGHIPFKPLPQPQAFAMFEWGLNWVVANNAHNHLIIHSAVLEKNGKALIFPGSPGSGKSTLCAGLVTQGWRLLSDEMALLSLKTGLLTPIPRPISLKNQSIDIIKSIPGNFFVGESVHDTAKGTVAHMSAPQNSVERSHELAKPSAVIFPKYRNGAETDLSPLSKGRTFLALADNSFNYHVLGETAFSALTTMIDQCKCYNFTYQDLDSAYETMDRLIDA